MSKLFILLIVLFVVIGCFKKKPIYSEQTKNDSLGYFIKLSNSQTLNETGKISAIDKAFDIASTLKNDSSNRDTLFNLSFKYYILKDWNKFNSASLFLIKRATQAKDTTILSKSYRYRGGYFKNTQNYDSAFIYYLKAEKIYDDLNDKINLATILLNKGIVQYSVNDYLGAELSLSKAYYIFRNSDEKEKLYGTQNQLGLTYNQLEDYEKSISFLNNALKTVRDNKLQNEQHPEVVCLSNIGFVYQNMKDYKKAIVNYENSLLNEDIKEDSPYLYANIIDNLAYCKLQIKEYSKLPYLFVESLKIREKLDDPTAIIISNNHLSEYYFNMNNKSLAFKYSKKALDLSKKTKNPINYLSALKQASLINEDYLLLYSKDYTRINDSLQIAERNSLNRFSRLQLETDELIKEKDVLEAKNRNILNYFMGAIIIGGVLFFMRIQRSRSRELALTQSQQQANEEIYRLIISHQNQLEEGRDLEKRHISKELHDGVLGRLFGLRLNLDGLNNFDDEDAKQQRLEYLNELQLIEQDLREISHELNRENLVLINNFVAIINNLLEQQAKINPAKVKSIIDVDIDWDMMPNTGKINLYRILQEALQNINKYAEAKNILVHFRKDKKGNLLFNIEDDGVGYDVNSKKSRGIGIKNIVSRTQQCQGIIDIKSEIGKGSKIIITFPLENKTIKL